MRWKTCNCCGTEYPHTTKYFHRDYYNKSGLRGDCKICNRARVRARYIPKQRIPPKEVKMESISDKLKHEIGDWLRWCDYLPNEYKPKGLIETSTKLLKELSDGVDEPILTS